MTPSPILVTTPKCIDGDSLLDWLKNYVADTVDAQEIFLSPHRPWDCTSESSTFAVVEPEELISKDTLLLRRLPCSNAHFAYFYIADAVSAAIAAGVLPDEVYHVYHKDSH